MPIPLVFYYNNNHQQSFTILKNIISQNKYQVLNEYDEFKIDIYVLLDNVESNIIAIDWDNTFTANIQFFQNLIDSYLILGLKPIICTFQEETKDNEKTIRAQLQRNIDVQFTNGESKQECLIKRNITINLWLDDLYPTICKEGCALLVNNGIDYEDKE